MTPVATGLETLIRTPHDWVRGSRLGLLCNPASVDRRLRHARDLIHARFPGRLTALFSPQHGFFAEKQDNMIESADMVDPVLHIPVYSLYGDTRIPTPAMMEGIDVLLIDLLDVGTRVYTFTTTVSYCLETAARLGKRVIVLDRPNPVGGEAVEGNVLEPGFTSFVGRYPIPMRHGLTMGEFAAFINEVHHIHCDLAVTPMSGWRRSMMFNDTGLPWVSPSPNLPTPTSALVYPGQVLLEGTNISEGRGTALPFEQFGAPFVDINRLMTFAGGPDLSGAVLRPAAFLPTSNKWTGQTCMGFQIHVTDPHRFAPYRTSLLLLQGILHHHPDRFQWKSPPYEYEWERRPFDLIAGSDAIRRQLCDMTPLGDMAAAWEDAIADYRKAVAPFLLYE